MSKDYGYPSFELICRASSGNEVAIKEILKFYDGYICLLYTSGVMLLSLLERALI